MKKTAAFIISILMLLFCSTPALAKEYKEYGISYSQPQGYVEINSDNAKQYESALKEMGHTVSSFKKYLTKNNIILFALQADNSRQIQLSFANTQFAKDIEDISFVEQEKLQSIGKKIVRDSARWNIVDVNGTMYFEVMSDAKGETKTCCVQYLTIKNGLVYSFVLYGDSSTVDDVLLQEARSTLSNLKIASKKGGISAVKADKILAIALNFALLAVAVVVVGLIIISFIKDAKRKNESDSDMGDLTIQRRRYK